MGIGLLLLRVIWSFRNTPQLRKIYNIRPQCPGQTPSGPDESWWHQSSDDHWHQSCSENDCHHGWDAWHRDHGNWHRDDWRDDWYSGQISWAWGRMTRATSRIRSTSAGCYEPKTHGQSISGLPWQASLSGAYMIWHIPIPICAYVLF